MQSKERAMPGQTAPVFDNDEEEDDGSDDDQDRYNIECHLAI